MSKLKNGVAAPKDAEDKEENHLDRILDSSACRKLFTWAGPQNADSRLREMDEEVREEQRLRWNFDFETETPLPGRYQWIRTDCTNGFRKNEEEAVRSRTRNGEVERRNSKQTLNTPYARKSREQPARSTRSCDRSLNGPRRSERNARVPDLRWN